MSENKLRPCPFCGEMPETNGRHVQCYLMPCDARHFKMPYESWQKRPIEDALKSRIAELEEERRWIPVSERLPEVGKVVDVIDMNDTDSHLNDLYEIAMSVEVRGKKMFGFIGNSSWVSSDVTHWMYKQPLPVLLKEREE